MHLCVHDTCMCKLQKQSLSLTGYGITLRHTITEIQSAIYTMLRRLAPLVTTILLTSSRIRPSSSHTLVRPFSVSSLYSRRSDIMGNQVSNKGDDPTYSAKEVPAPELTYTEEELKSRLTAEEYRVTQEKGRQISPLI